ncbi:MAG TPA: hypothetical protein DCG48_08410 [Rhodospirillaceae bacterium]|nr:hypothetical protein [Rhodospirillaceae bacterium]
MDVVSGLLIVEHYAIITVGNLIRRNRLNGALLTKLSVSTKGKLEPGRLNRKRKKSTKSTGTKS